MTTKSWCLFQSLCAVCAKGPIVSQYAHTVSLFYIVTQIEGWSHSSLSISSQDRRDRGADRHHHHVRDVGFRRRGPLANHGN